MICCWGAASIKFFVLPEPYLLRCYVESNYMMQKKVKIRCIDVGSKMNDQMCLALITIGRWPLKTHPPILNQCVTSWV